MSANRLVKLFVLITLVLIAAFAARQVAAKTGHIADRSYDPIEQLHQSLTRVGQISDRGLPGSAAQPMSSICPETECDYQLPNGLWVK